jgi:uncharacterized sodium:solute symporter family permease YidK
MLLSPEISVRVGGKNTVNNESSLVLGIIGFVVATFGGVMATSPSFRAPGISILFIGGLLIAASAVLMGKSSPV